MLGKMRIAARISGLAVVASLAAVHAQAATCEGLSVVSLQNTTITQAEAVPAGAFVPPPPARGRGANPFATLPAFCRVTATLKPTTDSDIKVEVWLPASGWNGKLEAVGNAGWAGFIAYPAMAI